MCKRFSDTGLWKQSWFIDLSPESKLVWFYLTSECNTAGICKLDMRQLKRDTGLNAINIKSSVEEINKDYDPETGDEIYVPRVLFVADGKKLWITGFISFQNEKGKNGVNIAVPAIKGAITRLQNEGLLEYALKNGFVRINGYKEGTAGTESVTGDKACTDTTTDTNIKTGNDLTAPEAANSPAAGAVQLHPINSRKVIAAGLPATVAATSLGKGAASSSAKRAGSPAPFAGEEVISLSEEICSFDEEEEPVTEESSNVDLISLTDCAPAANFQPLATDKDKDKDKGRDKVPGSCCFDLKEEGGVGEETEAAEVYQECWGRVPANPAELKAANELMDQYGADEFRFALKQSLEHKKSSLAYIRGILRNRHGQAAAAKSKEEALKKSEELKKQVLTQSRKGVKLNLLQQVYGTDEPDVLKPLRV